MGVLQILSCLALRQVLGDGAENVNRLLGDRLSDHGQRLLQAMRRSNERAWKALEVALAGEGLWNRLDRAEDRAFREQIRQFLEAVPLPALADRADFRRNCLRDLRTARKRGLLLGAILPEELAEAAGAWARFSDQAALRAAEHEALQGLAQELSKEGFADLAWLLAQQAQPGQSLIVVAVRYFFRREVDTDPNLRERLVFTEVEALNAGQREGFDRLEEALAQGQAALDRALDDIAGQLDEINAGVLDLRRELSFLNARLTGHCEVLARQVLQLLERLDLAGRPVRPSDSLLVRHDRERQAVRELLAQYQGLPAAERQATPALVNGLGQLQLAVGDCAGASDTFRQAAALAPDRRARAEAHHNAYRAALAKGDTDLALTELRQALLDDPERFAPFPLADYEPEAILGAGGFGVTFLCRMRLSGRQVAVKSLLTEGLDRDIDMVLQEINALEQLSHPAIIRLRHYGFADAARSRPYLVMDYFPGPNLDRQVRTAGPLDLPQALWLACEMAGALQSAHAEGILHRDVKPGNVLVDVSRRQLRLIDFGLALKQEVLQTTLTSHAGRTMTGISLAGTLDYAAPEQMGKLQGVKIGPPADVYGYARTLCFALFQTPQPLPKHWRTLPGELTDLLSECLAEDPRERPAGFAAVLSRLRPLLGEAPRRDAPDLVLTPLTETPFPGLKGTLLDHLRQAEKLAQAHRPEAVARRHDELKKLLEKQVAERAYQPAYQTALEILRLDSNDAVAREAVRLLEKNAGVVKPPPTQEDVLRLLREFLPQDDLHVAPEVPPRKLANACKSCKPPAGEPLLGLIDATVFGSAKNAFLFGATGVFYHNDWASKVAGADHVPYAEFPQRNFTRESWSEVSLDRGQFFNRSGSQVTSQKIVDILNAIKQLYTRT